MPDPGKSTSGPRQPVPSTGSAPPSPCRPRNGGACPCGPPRRNGHPGVPCKPPASYAGPGGRTRKLPVTSTKTASTYIRGKDGLNMLWGNYLGDQECNTEGYSGGGVATGVENTIGVWVCAGTWISVKWGALTRGSTCLPDSRTTLSRPPAHSCPPASPRYFVSPAPGSRPPRQTPAHVYGGTQPKNRRNTPCVT